MADGTDLPGWASPLQRRIWQLQGGPLTGGYEASVEATFAGPVPPGAVQAVSRYADDLLPGPVTLVDGDDLGDAGGRTPVRIAVVGSRTLRVTVPALAADERTMIHLVAAAAGGPGRSAPPPRRATRWWTELAADPRASAAREAWRASARRWPDVPDGLRLPASGTGWHHATAALDGPLLAALRRDPTPLADHLLAAWLLLLRRQLDAEPVVGVATDLRRPELRDCAGALTPYLPLPADVDPARPWSATVAGVAGRRDAAADTAAFFSWDACLPAGVTPATPLPAAFACTTLPRLSLPGGDVTVRDVAARSDHWSVALSCRDAGDAVTLTVEYADGIGAADQAAHWPRALLALLAAAVREPATPGALLPVMGDEQRARIAARNRGPAAPARPALPQLFREAAHRNPAATALRRGGEELSYAALAARVNRLARHLRAAGVGPEHVVAVALPPDFDLMVALLGVLTAGGAYAPVPPDYPAARVGEMLTEAGCRYAIAGAGVPLPVGIRRIDPADPAVAARPAGPLAVDVAPDHLAYAVFTSGSTGRPKAVLVTHEGLSNYLGWAARELPMTERSGSVVLTSIAFDLTIPTLFLPLLTGADVTFPAPGTDPVDALADALTGTGYSLVRCTPTHLRAALGALRGRRPYAGRLGVGGEELPTDLVRAWRKVARGGDIHNMYGPAETVVTRVSGRVGPDLPDGPSVPLGDPIDNTELHVLDRYLQPVPAGGTGELFIAGTGLARGYAGRPGDTAQRFVPHPVRPGARMYRTGDLVRRRADGTLVYSGRTDHQIKIRGHRVEPGEIETVLREQPGVASAVVVAVDGRLAAYLVGGRVPVEELRARLERRLPGHLIPARFVWLDALPTNRNGKLDRAALPDPARAGAAPRTAYRPPAGAAEEVLAEVWAAALGVARVGRDDNFFVLGGDSITTILVASEAARRGYEVGLRDFFEHQTLAELAAVARPAAVPDGPGDGPPAGGDLTPAQLAFLDRRLPHPGHVDQAVLLTPTRTVVPRHLTGAVAAVVAHHAALRSRFVADPAAPGGWRCVTETADRVAAPVHHLNLTGPGDLAAAVAPYLEFDLSAAPLLRVLLLDGGPDRQRIAVIAHHLVVDFVSWRIVLDDLVTAYRQRESGQPTRLPPATTPPDAWAAALRRAAGTPAVRQDLGYWTGQAPRRAAAPVPVTPGPLREGDRREVVVCLDEADTGTLLRDVLVRWRAQVDDIVLLALGLAVARRTGTPELHVDVEGHGRAQRLVDGVDLTRSVGWFTSVNPMLLRIPVDAPPAEQVTSVKRQLHGRPGHGLSYGALRRMAPDAASALAALPEPAISLNYVGPSGSMAGYRASADGDGFGLTAAAEPLPPLTHPENPMARPLSVNATVVDGVLQLGFSFPASRVSTSDVEKLAGEVADGVRELVAECRTATTHAYTPDDFPLLRTDQRGLDRLVGLALRAAPGGSGGKGPG